MTRHLRVGVTLAGTFGIRYSGLTLRERLGL
jgi:hypothetical protein